MRRAKGDIREHWLATANAMKGHRQFVEKSHVDAQAVSIYYDRRIECPVFSENFRRGEGVQNFRRFE